MYVSCWKAIGSPTLSQSPTTLEAFDRRESCPYGILQHLPISLEGKMVEIEVEVVDANITYNLLLGRSWTYAMQVVASSLFCIICFPHQGKIVTIDQLSFFFEDELMEPIIPSTDGVGRALDVPGLGASGK